MQLNTHTPSELSLGFERETQPFWQRLGKACAALFIGDSEPRIWQIEQDDGTVRWKAYDPTCDRCTTFGSEREVRLWLYQRYCK